ncbi:hypothetical protein [Agromyces binzhouensis]|uniref:Uncharacterized protein n=1 Tax=Agromyces binzhouensis TaxID=1817495 RepID=A0A4Q2JUB5_9MICO|nr:hypothetical protein [Agromyces binzhouensis]RXZ51842.1 hypothetical protein ESO86_00375 [Agromyces binzhouensis]
MADFIRVAITDLNGDGEPLPSNRDTWVNLDQVATVRGMLGNNLARRHHLHGAIDAEHYPLIEIRTTDRQRLLVSLGTHPTAQAGMAAIRGFLPTLVQSRTRRSADDELAELLADWADEAGH